MSNFVTALCALPNGTRIALHHTDARTFAWPKAQLCIADPPWQYDQVQGASAPPYPGMSYEEIHDVLWNRMHWSRMLLWITGAHLGPFSWFLASRGVKPPVTAGAWDKGAHRYGPGHTWGSRAEFLLVFYGPGDDAYVNKAIPVDNAVAWVAAGEDEHSVKPPQWTARLIRRFTRNASARGDAGPALVVSPFLGLGSDAEAAFLAERSFIGTELVRDRFERAVKRYTTAVAQHGKGAE
jgi:hypothetical protein